MKGKIIITTDSGFNSSLFKPYNDLILNNSKPASIERKINLVISNYEKFVKISKEIQKENHKIRSSQIYQKNLLSYLKLI